MDKKILIGIAFASGAAAGSVATWLAVKDIYKRRADEEIESVKETFAKYRKQEEPKEVVEKTVVDKVEEKTEIVPETSHMEGYVDYTSYSKETPTYMTVMDEPVEIAPYVISAEQVGAEPDYDLICLTYLSDKTLLDETGTPVKSELITDLLGTEWRETIAHEHMTYVRNDKLNRDYEITADERTFQEYVDDEGSFFYIS
jgi:hypothetical protein